MIYNCVWSEKLLLGVLGPLILTTVAQIAILHTPQEATFREDDFTGLGEARGQSHGMEEGLVATGFVRLRMISSRFATNNTCAAPRM